MDRSINRQPECHHILGASDSTKSSNQKRQQLTPLTRHTDGVVVVDDSNTTCVFYQGDWTAAAPAQPVEYNQTTHGTRTSGSTALLTFDGKYGHVNQNKSHALISHEPLLQALPSPCTDPSMVQPKFLLYRHIPSTIHPPLLSAPKPRTQLSSKFCSTNLPLCKMRIII